MRKILFTVTVLSILTTTAAVADGFKRIKKESDFKTIAVDKKLRFGGGTAIVQSDGKTVGTLEKQGKYYGAWAWQNGYYCRNLVISGKQTGTNCQLVEYDGKTLRFTRDKGKGVVTLLTAN